jgi:hypothetical protein
LSLRLKKRVKNVKDKDKHLDCCIIHREHIDYIFFEYLLKNHHDYNIKIGDRIDYLYIIPNPINNMYYQTMIKRLDKVYCC